MSSGASSGGVSLGGVVFVVFLILKLTHLINWSWWWVTCPLWGGLAIIVLIFLGAFGVALLGAGLHGAVSLKKYRIFNWFDSL